MVDILMAQLESNLKAALQMREAAENEARAVRDVLVDLALRFLAPEVDEVKRQGEQDPTQWPARELARWMKERLQARFNRLELSARRDLAEQLQKTLAENERLRRELAEANASVATRTAELTKAQEAIKAKDAELSGLRAEVAKLREELARAREAAAPIPAAVVSLLGVGGDESAKPEWFNAWRASRGFESEAAVVRVMGFQGLCLYQSIEKTLVGEGTIGAGSLYRVLERLQEQGFVEQQAPKTESSGKAAHFYWLSGKGCEAFRLLYGQEPVESEYQRLRARHKGDEHIALNLRARDVFVARGATVDLYPQRVTIQGEFYHDPDLVVVFPGENKPLYVECERGGAKRQRDAKWHNYAAVTRDFYLVVPNSKVQSHILSEITEWTLRTRQPITVHICNLSALTDDSPLWTLERQLRWSR